jgi:hypothetical protein
LPALTQNPKKPGKPLKNPEELEKSSFCLVEIKISPDYCGPEVERNIIMF